MGNPIIKNQKDGKSDKRRDADGGGSARIPGIQREPGGLVVECDRSDVVRSDGMAVEKGGGMERVTVRGNGALAERLGVTRWTVQEWRKRGILKPATLCDIGRVIIYDLEKVYECLNAKAPGTGSRRRRNR